MTLPDYYFEILTNWLYRTICKETVIMTKHILFVNFDTELPLSMTQLWPVMATYLPYKFFLRL